MTATTATAPVTLAQIGGKILRSMPLSLLRNILVILILSPIVWLFHTYLIVFPNDGFNGGSNWFLSTVLCLKGQVISATVFWFLLGTIIPAFIGGMWRAGGPVRYFTQIGDLVVKIVNTARAVGRTELPYLIGGAIGICVFQPFIHNTITNIMILLFLLRGLIDLNENSFLTVLGRAAQYDFCRHFQKEKPWSPAPVNSIFLVFSGMAAGVILMAMPMLQNLAIGVAVVLLVIYFINRSNKPQASARIFWFLLTCSATLLALSLTAMADDGGGPEEGMANLGAALNNPELFKKWLNTESAQICLRMGIPPAISLWFGFSFADAFLRSTRDITGFDTGPVNVPIPAMPNPPAAEPTAPDDPLADWHQKYKGMGWKYNADANTYEPKPGCFNEQGKVWCQPPWDIGGPYFMDRGEYDRMRQMQGEGKTWNNSDGWATDADHQMYKEQRDASAQASKDETKRMFAELAANDRKIAAGKEEIKAAGREVEQAMDALRGPPITINGYQRRWVEDYISQGTIDNIAWGLEKAQYVVDTGMSAATTAYGYTTGNPKAGDAIMAAYTVAKETAGGMSTAWANNQSIAEGAYRGAVKGAISAGVDKAVGTGFEKVTDALGGAKLVQEYGGQAANRLGGWVSGKLAGQAADKGADAFLLSRRAGETVETAFANSAEAAEKFLAEGVDTANKWVANWAVGDGTKYALNHASTDYTPDKAVDALSGVTADILKHAGGKVIDGLN